MCVLPILSLRCEMASMHNYRATYSDSPKGKFLCRRLHEYCLLDHLAAGASSRNLSQAILHFSVLPCMHMRRRPHTRVSALLPQLRSVLPFLPAFLPFCLSPSPNISFHSPPLSHIFHPFVMICGNLVISSFYLKNYSNFELDVIVD